MSRPDMRDEAGLPKGLKMRGMAVERRPDAKLTRRKMTSSVKVIRSVADLRVVIHRNERPIYFISATNFNLLGIDEWVKTFKFISYIDCFDGRHPNVFVPSEIPHAEFDSIEDINNYLLQHKEVIDHIKKRGERAVATFLMFDETTERICEELGIEVWFPISQLRQRCDN